MLLQSNFHTKIAEVNKLTAVAWLRQKATNGSRWLFSRDTQFYELIVGMVLLTFAGVIASPSWRVPNNAVRGSLNTFMPDLGWAAICLGLGMIKVAAVMLERRDVRRFISLVSSGWWAFFFIAFMRSAVLSLGTFAFLVFLFGSMVSYRHLCLTGIGGKGGSK